jgi:hypothetical protein
MILPASAGKSFSFNSDDSALNSSGISQDGGPKPKQLPHRRSAPPRLIRETLACTIYRNREFVAV